MVVRATLSKASCAVRLHPDVCACARSSIDFGLFGAKPCISRAHSARPARSLAISIACGMPTPQKKLRRGAKASTSRPAASPARTYSSPSASV